MAPKQDSRRYHWQCVTTHDPTRSNGHSRGVCYGILSRSAGQAFLQVPDQTRREVWGEWTSGWTSLRSAFGQQWNNVIEDSTRPRLEQTYGKFGVAWKRPVWPEITLTYAHNSLNLSASRHNETTATAWKVHSPITGWVGMPALYRPISLGAISFVVEQSIR